MRVALVMLALLPVAASAAPAPDGPVARAAAKPKCFGKKATIVGTGKSDKGRRKIKGTRKADVIVAKGGADDVRGGGGNDLICAGGGNDKVDGGGGNDLIDGGAGKDRLKGGAGDDGIAGGAGNDTIDGGRGTDGCDGGKGKNKLKRCEPLPLTGPQGPGGGGGGGGATGPTGPTGLTRAAPDSATTTEDASTTIPVLANDTGNGLTIKSVSPGAAKGTLTISGGSIVYDPAGKFEALAPGAFATETFTYTVAAGSGATATGTVTVRVTGVDDVATAVADAKALDEDAGETAVDVLANDTDPDGGAKAVASVTQPGDGAAAVTGDGAGVSYTPDLNFCGEDSFTYTLTSGTTATVTLTVACVDDAPVAVDDAADVNEGTPTVLDVLANDTDVDGGPKEIGSVNTFGASGTVTVAADGSDLTYTPGVGVCGVTDTFTYTLTTGDTATVTVTVVCAGSPPTAVNDSKTVSEDAGATAIDVLANDTDPDGGVKRVVSATDPANGTVVVTGNGTGLTYAPDANYCNSPPGTTLDTFSYTVNGGSTATVTVTVTCVDDAPTAVADAKTLNEDAAATTIDVLANDTDIDGGPKTVQSVGTAGHGTATLTSGVVKYAPAANYCGPDSFTYTLNGGSSATVTLTVTCVNDPPVADADAFAGGIQGVRMRVGTTHADAHETEHTGNVLEGDTDVDTPVASLTVTPGTITTADGGTVIMAANGTFTYDPPAGDDGSDSFSYTVEDNDTGDPDATERTATGTVTLSRSGPRVWFVDDSAPAGGRGVSHSPLQSLAPLAASGTSDGLDAAGDRIFVYSGTYASGIDLEANQKLIGQPNGLVVNTATLVAAGGTKPAISSATGHAVTVAAGTEVQDLVLGNTPAASYSLHAPAAAGAYTVADTDVNNGTGGGANLADGTPAVSLGTLSSNNASGSALRITDTDGGSVSATGGTLQDAAGTTVHIANAASSLSLGSTINDDVGQLVSIANSAGAQTFSGAVTDGGDGDGGGISLVNNDASTMSFTGGLTLATGTAEAFAASLGGTLVVTGAANTIDASGGGLRVTDTNIGAAGLTFRSIRSVGGTNPGIHLHNTGTAGGLTVTGSGTVGSGGTIADKPAPDGATGGNGVLLHNTRNVSLSRVQLDDLSNHAIRGTDVNGFSLIDSVVNGANGNNVNINEGAISFENLTGAAAITRSTVSGGALDNIRVVNTAAGGVLNRLTVESSIIGLNSHDFGNDGILLEGSTGTFNVTVNNSTFQGARGDHIDLNIINTGVGNFQFTNNTLNNAHGNSLGGSINADASGSGNLTYLVDNNTINGAKGTAIFIGKQFGGAPGTGTAVGVINNNRVGTAGTASSGSLNGSGIEVSTLARGKHSAVVTNNTVRQYRDNGINLFVGGAPTSTTGLAAHDAAVNYTVTGNTVGNPAPVAGAGAGAGIFLNSATNSGDTYQVCLNMQNNALAGSAPIAAASQDIWLRQRFGAVVRLPGYTGAEHNGSGTLANDLRSYMLGRGNTFNTLNASAQDTVAGGGGFFNTSPAGSACPTT